MSKFDHKLFILLFFLSVIYHSCLAHSFLFSTFSHFSYERFKTLRSYSSLLCFSKHLLYSRSIGSIYLCLFQPKLFFLLFNSIRLKFFIINIIGYEVRSFLAILLCFGSSQKLGSKTRLQEVIFPSSYWISPFCPLGDPFYNTLGPSAVWHACYPREPVSFPLHAFLDHSLHPRSVSHPFV